VSDDEAVEVSVEGATKVFGSRRSNRLVAVDDVSLTVDTTSLLGIIGESGSGKTTLARLLVGLEPVTAGVVTFNGRPISELSKRGWREFRKAVQMVAQDTSSSFDPRRTLRDAVRVPVQRLCGLDLKEADERVDRTLELLNLPPALAGRRPAEVSGGQRQRFALARALVVEPRVLVCDEVVSALDVSVQGSILNLLKRYCRENRAGLAFVSHGLAATAFIADDLAVMHRGRVVERGNTSGLLEVPAHPYTASLLRAHRGRPDGHTLAIARGDREGWACRYASTCSRVTAACESERPVLTAHNGRSVACHERMDRDLVLTKGGSSHG
jgi:peptide/nickel transport system ATP-binding protein